MLWALLAYMAAQLADIITTERALRRGAREANPVVRWLMHRLGRGWILAKLAGAGAVAVMAWQDDMAWLLWLLAVATALAAWHNTRVMRRPRRPATK